MQVCRKKGTQSPVWPYHPLLAGRADIEVILIADPERPPKASEKKPDADGDHKQETAPHDQPTSKAEILEVLKDRGVKVPSGAKKAQLKKLLDESEE